MLALGLAPLLIDSAAIVLFLSSILICHIRSFSLSMLLHGCSYDASLEVNKLIYGSLSISKRNSLPFLYPFMQKIG
jgi:hypothetical protein